jgi:porin
MRLGVMDLNADFDSPLTLGHFVGPPHGIGSEFSQSGQNGPAIWPATALGFRVAAKLTPAVHWRFAAYDAVPGSAEGLTFASVALSAKQGALLVSEIEYSSERINRLSIGAWSYTSAFEPVDAAIRADSSARTGNRGLYSLLDIAMVRLSSVRIDGALRIGIANGEFNPTSHYVGAALVASHFMASRRDDALGLAVAQARTGSEYRRAMAFSGLNPTATETSIELTYRAPVTAWMTLVPLLQWVSHPGADRSVRNAFVAGIRFEFASDHGWALLAKQGRVGNTSVALLE